MIGERAPLRPTLPVALWLALALWVGLALGEGLSAASHSRWLAWPLCCAAISLVVTSVLDQRLEALDRGVHGGACLPAPGSAC